MSRNRRIDPTERAHLLDERGYTPPIHRFAPDPALVDLVRRYWMPVWSLPAGRVSAQRVLQYPVCLLVVSDSYAILVGPSSGLSVQELSGTGWALGVMLQPAAGQTLAGGSVARITDQRLPLAEAGGLDGAALAHAIRAAVADRPTDAEHRQAAVAALEESLRGLPPANEEGRLVNAIVEYVESDPSVRRVEQICTTFTLTERSLQRLTARRIGLGPKWLIQRRRLHEAAERLRVGGRGDLARLAADLGYADQAHFGRDFRAVTGLTPGAFAAEPRG